MDIRMNYDEGKNYMKNKCNLGADTFIPESTYSSLTITYPGYKGNGDYRVKIVPNSNPPTHFDVCEYLHNKIAVGTVGYDEMLSLLEDIYVNGTNIDFKNHNINEIKKLTTLIFWMTLQDEINYPQPHYQGRRMPFSRYFEAIYCAAFEDCTYTLSDVMRRCNNRGMVPAPYQTKDKPSFYY